jgi:hypothetical protein
MKLRWIALSMAALSVLSCKKDGDNGSGGLPASILNFKLHFDSTMVRLNDFGQPVSVPAGHYAMHPKVESMTVHYMELCPNENTPLGQGVILYNGPETNAGGALAIDYSRSTPILQNQKFFSYNLQSIPPGTYKYLRVGLGSQKMEVKTKWGAQVVPCGIVSFIGYNTYVQDLIIDNQEISINQNQLQGSYGFVASNGVSQNYGLGDSFSGNTTVPNSIYATSPIPIGSSVVTGEFEEPFVVTNEEGMDRNITIHVSTNKSFEWIDSTPDGVWDPTTLESVVDMGVRGMLPVEE